MKEPTVTQKKIFEMLTENTGTHFLDSGGSNGRMWQRNQKRTVEDFMNDDVVYLRAKYYSPTNSDVYGIISLFHFLSENLEYDPYMDRLFQRFVSMNEKHFWEYWDEKYQHQRYDAEQQEWIYWTAPKGYGDFYWSKAMDAFWKLAKKDSRQGNRQWMAYEFDRESFHGYTYNYENDLSQDFVYRIMGGYAFIQIHGGCDACVGFTYPVLFKVKTEYGLLEYSRYTIGCTGEHDHWWDFEGGYSNTETEVDWKDCEVIDLDDPELADKYAEDLKEWEFAKRQWVDQLPLPGVDKPELPPKPTLNLYGKIGIKDGKAYCPICGQELAAYAYWN